MAATRRWAWLTLSALGLALAARWIGDAEPDAPRPPALAPRQAIESGASTGPVAEPPTAPASSSAVAAASAPTTARSRLKPRTGADQIEVCGLGWYSSEELKPMKSALAPTAPRERLRALLAQGSERERAVAALLAQVAANERWLAQAGPACASRDAVCAARRADDAAAATSATLADAVNLARLTQDPWVYGLIYTHVCRGRGAGAANPNACGLLSTERWAELNAQDALPWLHAAAEASTRRDAAAVVRALDEAARRPRLGTTQGQATAVLLSHPGYRQLEPLAQMAMLVEQVGISAGQRTPEGWLLPRYCAVEAVTDTSRRSNCDALVRLMLNEPGELLRMAVAARIADRLDWPREQLQALQDEVLAAQMASTRQPMSDTLFSCEGIAALQQRWTGYTLHGEAAALVAVARASAKASGRTLAEVAAAERAARAERQRAQRSSAGGTNERSP